MSISVKPENIKALALDLDGTILAPGVALRERTIRAVNACQKRGIRVIINTGRTIDGAERFRAALGVEGPMIYCNGAVVADMPEGRPLSTILLAKEAAAFCVDLSRETGAYCQVFFPGGTGEKRTILMAEREGPHREMYAAHAGRRAELGDLKEALNRHALEGCIKSMFLAEPDVLNMLRSRIEERLGKSVYVAQTLRTFLEIMDANASKGRGLAFVMKRYSLKSGEVMAFGDEENDLPMFAVSGFSAAPANAKDSVKAAADIVIGSNAEDGVAAFLEEFFGL
ncbi:MAG: Cof-type HAD-IIB family hydrolase [Treponema sp.]|nr:Cof-type HAD-IIB family hydrolase [Treponema sp.]